MRKTTLSRIVCASVRIASMSENECEKFEKMWRILFTLSYIQWIVRLDVLLGREEFVYFRNVCK